MSQESEDLARVLSIQANIDALKIHAEGYKASNQKQQASGQEPWWVDAHFEAISNQIIELSKQFDY